MFGFKQLVKSNTRKTPRLGRRKLQQSLPLRRNLPWGVLGVVATVTACVLYFQDNASAEEKAETPKKKKVVVLGSGWATISLLKKINPRMWDEDLYEVIVVSPRNYFLFTPLLPECTTGTLQNSSIMTPIRLLLSGKKYTSHFYEASCIDVDPTKNQIRCQDSSVIAGGEFTLDYDYLVVAVGSEPATFGTPGVRENTHFLKSVNDAKQIRLKILDCLETASLPHLTQADRKKLLSFVVVGGGPTGCEFAGELHDFIESDGARFFPEAKKDVTITLIQSAEVILNSFDASIAQYAQSRMEERKGMKILTNKRVLEVEPHSVKVLDKGTKESFDMPYGLCVWSTGVVPNSLIPTITSKIPEQTSRAGLLTDKFLKVKGTDNIYAIGDCAVIEQPKIGARMAEVFATADKDGDGAVSFEEFESWMNTVVSEYPQFEPLAKDLFKTFHEADTDQSGALSKKEFEHVLYAADASLKNLPTTAQVAAQEGAYLGNAFRTLGKGKKPKEFKYHQVAQFAYIGKDNAIGEVPFFKGGGLMVFLMWKGVYLGYQQSLTNVVSVFFDWCKTILLGRDISHH